MENSLRELAFQLDNEINRIGSKVDTLSDIQNLLGRLREDMESIDEKDVLFYFREFFLKVRIMDELMYYSMEELNGIYEKTDEISNQLFHGFVNGVEK
ncbi:hypothetical protein FZC66_19330 [Priestia megaterium]|nr:hypothetical protein FZC66_19330 [Priestia megaterium]